MNMEMMKPFTELEKGTVVGSSTLASVFGARHNTFISLCSCEVGWEEKWKDF